MIIKTMRRESIVETLLNTLEAERYMRGPLLNTIVDELAADAGLLAAADAARALFAGLESGQLKDRDFVVGVVALRQLVRARVASVSASAA